MTSPETPTPPRMTAAHIDALNYAIGASIGLVGDSLSTTARRAEIRAVLKEILPTVELLVPEESGSPSHVVVSRELLRDAEMILSRNADGKVMNQSRVNYVRRMLQEMLVGKSEVDPQEVCPKCGEKASHQMPLIQRGHRELWCPNAHYWFVPLPPSTDTRAEKCEFCSAKLQVDEVAVCSKCLKIDAGYRESMRRTPFAGQTVKVGYALGSSNGGAGSETVTVQEVESNGQFFRATNGYRYQVSCIVQRRSTDTPTQEK